MEIHLIGYGPPEQHEVFKQWVISRKYPFEGFRKGYNKPFLIEARPYTIKIKKDCAKMFLSELKGSTEEMSGSNRAIPRIINNVTKVIYKVMGLIFRKHKDIFRLVDMKNIKTGDNTLFEWFKTQVLFTQDDVIKKGKEEL